MEQVFRDLTISAGIGFFWITVFIAMVWGHSINI